LTKRQLNAILIVDGLCLVSVAAFFVSFRLNRNARTGR
jgi:hypothetical protein